MGWFETQEMLSSDEVTLVRHAEGRKVGIINNLHKDEKVTLPKSVAIKLDTMVDSRSSDEFDTFAELRPRFAGSVFILKLRDHNYLINTEGFSYCRYAARLIVK